MKTRSKPTQFALFFIGLIAALFLDQWTKYQAVLHLKDGAPLVIWDGVFELLYSENRGAAFGMLQGRQTFFFLVAAVVVIVVMYAMIRMPATRHYLPLELCMLLVLSGALGNMIDRVSQGYVVDFLYFKLINFPIFNVADCYVTVSAFILVLLFLFYYKEEDLQIFSLKKGV